MEVPQLRDDQDDSLIAISSCQTTTMVNVLHVLKKSNFPIDFRRVFDLLAATDQVLEARHQSISTRHHNSNDSQSAMLE